MPNLFNMEYYGQIANKVTLEDPNSNKIKHAMDKENRRVYLNEGEKKWLKYLKEKYFQLTLQLCFFKNFLQQPLNLESF